MLTPEGEKYLEQVVRADPGTDLDDLRNRAIDQITSGRELPRIETINDPLVKIVPRGIAGNGERIELPGHQHFGRAHPREPTENGIAIYASHGDKGPFFHASVDGRQAAQQPATQNLELAEHFKQQQVAQEQLDLQHQNQKAQRTA